MLRSLYAKNPDGIGFMGAGLQEPIRKLPRNFRSLSQFYRMFIHGKAGAVHFRWRTDGDISRARVHPYEVLPGKLWMMHNGVLNNYRSGHKDPESDTQKLIKYTLRPLLEASPDLWRKPEFHRLLREAIGVNNRLVFVDHETNIEVINRSTGYEVGEDWYANAYSFDAERFFPEVFAPKPTQYLGTPALDSWVQRPAAPAAVRWKKDANGVWVPDRGPVNIAQPAANRVPQQIWERHLGGNHTASQPSLLPPPKAATSPADLLLAVGIYGGHPDHLRLRAALERMRNQDSKLYYDLLKDVNKVLGAALPVSRQQEFLTEMRLEVRLCIREFEDDMQTLSNTN